LSIDSQANAEPVKVRVSLEAAHVGLVH
jgi:hypothetical protein